MKINTLAQAQHVLNANGFPCGAVDGRMGPRTRDAVIRFQQAFLGIAGVIGALRIDGQLGPKTLLGLEQLPKLSPNFTTSELRQRHGGPCYVRRELVFGLELLRLHARRSIPVISGYRGVAYNASVGGARGSLHTYGLAADIPGSAGITLNQARAMRIWSGIGTLRGIVRHVDLRHLPPRRHPATPARPSLWTY